MFKITKKRTVIILILILGSLVRLLNLSTLPPSLNWDEVSHGYNAFSILKTGRDEWGMGYPLLFRAYGDYKLPTYIYITAVAEKILGLTPLAVRLTSALAGIGSILILYLIVIKLFPNNWSIAWLSALLLAVSPWSVFISRVALEGNLAYFFCLLGLFLLLKQRYTSGFIALVLALYTYYIFRLFVPMILVLGWSLYRSSGLFDKITGRGRIGLGIMILSMGLVIYQTLFGQGSARYNLIGLIDAGAVERIGQLREAVSLPDPIPRFLVNKITVGLVLFLNNYVSYFRPDYLFVSGGTNYQFSLPNYGLIYWFNGPFLAIGLFFVGKRLFSRETNKELLSFKVFLGWLVIAPIAASLTRDSPHPLRSLIMLPPLLAFISLGIVVTKKWLSKYHPALVGGLLAVVIVINLLMLLNFWKRYETYSAKFSWAWQYGYSQVIAIVRERYLSEDTIIITKKYGEPHEFLLFYWPWDPQKYQSDKRLVRYFQSNWYWVDGFDKFVFINDWEIKQKQPKITIPDKTLLITSPGNYIGGTLIESIKLLDGQPAFDIVQL
ncbi:MAG: hypothetical protein UW69_C0001G0024 [Microgenomates group bacterium GW2011_GWA2_44_7]|nr:MAG: hypothetical protein UW69_C0001G0024 [Microgenomates group bacterium GW2011_GWA2_44_7]KKT78407.1 MAG: hypothetical protein UW73_C0003G0055 [Microgenomates group bacterium GW2011_GWB1_44_8]